MRSHAFALSTQRIQYWFLYPRHRLLQIHARVPSDNHSDNKFFKNIAAILIFIPVASMLLGATEMLWNSAYFKTVDFQNRFFPPFEQ